MRNSNQLRSHGKNLFEAINAAVNSLSNIESLNLLLIDLGARHSEYGAKIEHFPVNYYYYLLINTQVNIRLEIIINNLINK